MSGDMLPIPAAVLTVGIIRLLSSLVKVVVYEGLGLQASLPNQSAQAGDSSHESADIQQASHADLSIPTLPSARLIAEPVAEWLSFH